MVFERCKDRFMNIQIFGTKKCNDTKKAQRYLKNWVPDTIKKT